MADLSSIVNMERLRAAVEVAEAASRLFRNHIGLMAEMQSDEKKFVAHYRAAIPDSYLALAEATRNYTKLGGGRQ